MTVWRRRSQVGSHPVRGPWTIGLAAIGFVLLGLPVAAVFYLSLHEDVSHPGSPWTIEPYSKLFGNPDIMHALSVSSVIGIGSAMLTVTFGICAALVAWRGPRSMARIILGAMAVLLVIPDLVLGIGLLMWFGQLHLGTGPHAIVLAHATASMALVVMTLISRLRVFDLDILDAARDLGARPLQVFRWVILPLLLPGITGSLLLALTYSFDDFILGFLLGSPGIDSATLPVKLYDMTRFHPRSEIFALGMLMMSPALIWAFWRLLTADDGYGVDA
jgi:spermidine/putrescine transport system permease protein